MIDTTVGFVQMYLAKHFKRTNKYCYLTLSFVYVSFILLE